jgi:hypothetical protein
MANGSEIKMLGSIETGVIAKSGFRIYTSLFFESIPDGNSLIIQISFRKHIFLSSCLRMVIKVKSL